MADRTNAIATRLRVGDPVMVIAGGNSKKGRVTKGNVGKVLRFDAAKTRAYIEGVNMIKRHKKAQQADDSSGILEKEGSVAISNLMYYVEAISKPVRITVRSLEDGRKVRGFIHPETKDFEQIDA